MTPRRPVELWIAWVRLAAVVFAILEVGLLSSQFPPRYESAAWLVTGVFFVGAAALVLLAQRSDDRQLRRLGAIALVFDTAIVWSYATIFTYEYGNQTRWATIFVLVEAALRYGLAGGILMPVAAAGYFAFNEWWRGNYFGPPGFRSDRVTFPSGVVLLTGLIVGWLVRRLDEEAHAGSERAGEAERLRDELGRRVDVLEAANRSARALGSSLEIEQAFGAFIREVRGLVPFDRTAIVLVDGDSARTIATAGIGASEVFPPGSIGPLRGSVLERVLGGEVVVRRDLAEVEYPEDRLLVERGLHSELLAPLMLGARPIGMISLSRKEVAAFADEEVELVSLLGRLVATAVQNIRAYEAERHTVDELRRLSALRADFVSLVSHELRSPMAAVIGAARTLQERWRLLNAGQREAFLALIADETNRLAALIGDVLDTSRIEAGTFSLQLHRRRPLAAAARRGVGRLDRPGRGAGARRRAGAAAADPRRPRAAPAGAREPDRQRGQVLAVGRRGRRSRASGRTGSIRITVSDRGPGIPRDQQGIIFEKFGRADVAGASKPGTGLGLFIARSIAEAHGGTLDVSSGPDAGSSFTLTLPS